MLNFLSTEKSNVSEVLKNSLEIFWKGMLAMLIVIAIIFLVTFLMTYFSHDAIRERVEKKKAKDEYGNKKS